MLSRATPEPRTQDSQAVQPEELEVYTPTTSQCVCT